jgi:nucleoside-diphosphate kinase
MPIEKTLVLVKPDGVRRALVGEIISRFERAGLTIEALGRFNATLDKIERHYPSHNDWFASVGDKTRVAYQRDGLDLIKTFGSDDPVAIGKVVKSWLGAYMTSGPVVGMVLSGNRAIALVRKLVGHTFPNEATPGTIRGDYGNDSPDVANREARSIQNLIHASGNPEEAQNEIALWFGTQKS